MRRAALLLLLLLLGLGVGLGVLVSVCVEGKEETEKDTTEEEAFERFVREHGRQYRDEAERVKRRARFESTLAEIRAHDEEREAWGTAAAGVEGAARRSAFRLKVNDFADWYPEEIERLFSPQPDAVREHRALWERPEEQRRHRQRQRRRALRDSRGGSAFKDATDVDWTSHLNPRGRAIAVRKVHNQGQCGSCWAFTAAATTEASVAINTGNLIELSVQELLDCDTLFNRGCLGGNSLLAYNYIARYGLAAWRVYPYHKEQRLCRQQDVVPVSSVTQYGIIPSMSESAILDVVRETTVAVGLCGTDRNFLFYGSGVYNDPGCCTEVNHAMTIVGFGVDEATGLDYWLLKNSWGPLWGMNGFMKLQRRSDNVVGIGTCGMASNPSFAIGGYGGNATGISLPPQSGGPLPASGTGSSSALADNASDGDNSKSGDDDPNPNAGADDDDNSDRNRFLPLNESSRFIAIVFLAALAAVSFCYFLRDSFLPSSGGFGVCVPLCSSSSGTDDKGATANGTGAVVAREADTMVSINHPSEGTPLVMSVTAQQPSAAMTAGAADMVSSNSVQP